MKPTRPPKPTDPSKGRGTIPPGRPSPAPIGGMPKVKPVKPRGR